MITCKNCNNRSDEGKCLHLAKELELELAVKVKSEFCCSLFSIDSEGVADQFVKTLWYPNKRDFTWEKRTQYYDQFKTEQFEELVHYLRKNNTTKIFSTIIYRHGYSFYKHDKISAIKMVKQITSERLRWCKEFVEKLEESTPRYFKLKAIEEIEDL